MWDMPRWRLPCPMLVASGLSNGIKRWMHSIKDGSQQHHLRIITALTVAQPPKGKEALREEIRTFQLEVRELTQRAETARLFQEVPTTNRQAANSKTVPIGISLAKHGPALARPFGVNITP